MKTNRIIHPFSWYFTIVILFPSSPEDFTLELEVLYQFNNVLEIGLQRSVKVPARCSSMLFGFACSGLKTAPLLLFLWCSVIHVGVISCLLS